ncbi:major facilitator superfamily MFS_1 [Pseudopedobacter saltans DSM 12145]|uniref:Major facilitator superfamily MFS_1 n=1 Tax=Pseudopedobacter saltans (strain ATCC 51119 / DSM 12145 / JCM 21818 / CCUG 39354 / LMG 10337 / NBRC 100064 / NCIMB 13643) TaxID=762903 RepID=F0SBG6_PSESL|nr:MFS transporter [Pseudopedobacter saltans]ADY51612.1 major facilitator superfamily MFS_1 [Pseudopedobacter saltans DSM 12145]
MSNSSLLKKSDISIMALATGLIVANLYYCQPLIHLIAVEFNITESVAGKTIYLTQFGYAAGLLLLVPLGDKYERKKQIILVTAASCLFLVLAAVSNKFWLLQIACFGIGFSSVSPQLILPMVAALSKPQERGKLVGIVMSGLLIGILLSRTLSGFVGEFFGWRSMFWVASLICAVLTIIISFRFPKSEVSYTGTYLDLLKSLKEITYKYAVLREASLINFVVFATFGIFWTTMVLYLGSEAYQYTSEKIGLFGLVGATGAMLAPIVGRLSDKSNSRVVVGYGILILIFSMLIFYFFGGILIAFILGIIVLEIGQQSVHVSNQTRIYALSTEARNRLNTVFMTASFIGTASGSAFGIFLWTLGGWKAACLGAILILALVFIYYKFNKASNPTG